MLSKLLNFLSIDDVALQQLLRLLNQQQITILRQILTQRRSEQFETNPVLNVPTKNRQLYFNRIVSAQVLEHVLSQRLLSYHSNLLNATIYNYHYNKTKQKTKYPSRRQNRTQTVIVPHQPLLVLVRIIHRSISLLNRLTQP